MVVSPGAHFSDLRSVYLRVSSRAFYRRMGDTIRPVLHTSFFPAYLRVLGNLFFGSLFY